MTPTMLMAQGFQVGNISGVATDQTGGALPGVSITITHTERGTNRTEVTDAQGRYRFAGLPLGTYRLEATLEGFAPTTHNVRVEADKTNTIDVTMSLAAASEAITVTAEAPVVDPTNTTTTTRLSTEEYEKAPIGRNYQSITAFAPGVSRAGSNPNVNGALTANNQYLFDGVDVTDPTTGTFGANINFEAIQEVNVMTTGTSAEYGRTTGAVVSVITKSGTNDFEGSAKIIASNDDWNAQNKARNQVTGASLARTKVDHVNKRYAGTLGGPLWRDHLWFFGAYEEFKPVVSYSRTLVTQEEYGSARNEKFQNYRANWQITPSHQVWAKWNEDPISGIVRADYSGGADLYTLHLQGQGGEQKNAQYSGVFGSNFSVDAAYGEATNIITVEPYAIGPYDNGSLIVDINTGDWFNGGQFGAGNFVERPRTQWNVAGTMFTTLGGNSHEFKVGVDSQEFESTSYYNIANDREYDVTDYNPATGTFTPFERYDYENNGPQTSAGDIQSLYVRDKFSIGRRFNAEAGLRFEKQGGQNDVGQDIIDATALAPRFGFTYDLTNNGRMLLTGSVGRFNGWILQSFSDNAAQGVSRTNYKRYEWNAATGTYVFAEEFRQASGAQLPVSTNLDPDRMDEVTLGLQRQIAANAGVTVRGIYRKFGNFVEDKLVYTGGQQVKTYYNNDDLERTYKGVQFTFDKRFANNWSLYGNYTYSQTEGNQFSTFSSAQDDFFDQNCRSTTDPTIGTIPCSQAIGSLAGRPNFDVPHVLNVLGTYGMNLGRVDLTFGGAGNFRSGYPYSKTTAIRVINPNNPATGLIGSSYTYYYEGSGSERLPSVWSVDGSVEATFGVWRNVEIGVKGEIFNLLNRQEQIDTTLTAWCNESNVTATCATNRARHGLATATSQFQAPRSFRVTTLLRF
ncbi:MAG TPA: TonB-dependent receptor [Thermoanaerobaculia bacterium]